MAYGTPADPVAGTVITVAYAVANLLDPIRWLRQMTGNADPPGSNYWLRSTSTTAVSWVDRAAEALAALGFTPVNKAGDTMTGSLTLSGATTDLSVGRNIAATGGVSAATLSASGAIAGASGTFSGAVSAASYGAVAGTTGSFSGALAAASISSAGAIAATTGLSGASVSATGAGTALAVTNNASIGGSLSALSAAITNAITAATLTLTGLLTGVTATFSGLVTAQRFQSTQTTGTAPFTVASTTGVTNLNADMVDGLHSTDLARLAAASDFTTAPTINGDAIAVMAVGNYGGANGTARQVATGFLCKYVLITTNTGGGTSAQYTLLSSVAANNQVLFDTTGVGVDAQLAAPGVTRLHGSDGFIVDAATDASDVSGNTYFWIALG